MTVNVHRSDSAIRIGAVSYLNTKPLVYALDRLAPEAQLVFDLPSRLADQLACGSLDVALIPSIEYFNGPDYTIVSNACIACRGPVLSVKLLSRKPMAQIRTLALDEGSRTSVALVQILLMERFGITPRLEPLRIGERADQSSADAVLVIGDRAIHASEGEFTEQWDLGDQWCRWSELPFVFAMWTARRNADLDGVQRALGAARDEGLLHLEEIAAAEAPAVGLDVASCLSYLRDNLHFTLGAAEQRGMELFRQHAMRLGFVLA